MRMNRLDKVLKISIIHSKETGLVELRENLDLIWKVEEQVKLLQDLALDALEQGLSIKQKYLLKGTINELRIKFKSLSPEDQERLYEENKNIQLKEMIVGS